MKQKGTEWKNKRNVIKTKWQTHKEKDKRKLVKMKYEEQKKPEVKNEKNTFNRETEEA